MKTTKYKKESEKVRKAWDMGYRAQLAYKKSRGLVPYPVFIVHISDTMIYYFDDCMSEVWEIDDVHFNKEFRIIGWEHYMLGKGRPQKGDQMLDKDMQEVLTVDLIVSEQGMDVMDSHNDWHKFDEVEPYFN
jgi:hypothetical protein